MQHRIRICFAQLRIADKVTAFAGSMPFVYLHAALFAVWMLFFEERPWPTLTRRRPNEVRHVLYEP